MENNPLENNPFDPEIQDQSLESKIVVALERISEAFRVLLWNEGKEHRLSPLQVRLLIFLMHHGKSLRTVSALAAEFNLTKATVSEAVRVLERKGLIGKEEWPGDSRSYSVRLTAAGEETAARTARFTQHLQRPIQELSRSGKEDFLLNLMDIIRHLNRSGVVTIQRMCWTCSYYSPAGSGQSASHFCKLLQQPLQVSEFRLDCPEHRTA